MKTAIERIYQIGMFIFGICLILSHLGAYKQVADQGIYLGLLIMVPFILYRFWHFREYKRVNWELLSIAIITILLAIIYKKI